MRKNREWEGRDLYAAALQAFVRYQDSGLACPGDELHRALSSRALSIVLHEADPVYFADFQLAWPSS